MNSDTVIPPPTYAEAMIADAVPNSNHQEPEALLGVKNNDDIAEEEKRKKSEWVQIRLNKYQFID